jgi:hypothetical protein
MEKRYLYIGLLLLVWSCKKNGNSPANQVTTGSVVERTETGNGITYRLFIVEGQANYKGIVIMGSGNDENNPSPGSLNGTPESEFCEKSVLSFNILKRRGWLIGMPVPK